MITRLNWITAFCILGSFDSLVFGFYGSAWGFVLGYLMGVSYWHFLPQSEYGQPDQTSIHPEHQEFDQAA
jgi:hypothetical protein